MEYALEMARKAESEDEVPVGAVIVHEDQIVGQGYNQRERLQDPLAHAEMVAIREAAQHLKSWRLEKCTLYVTLEPCPMCLAAIQQSRIQKVFYGAEDLKGGALSLGYTYHQDPRTNHRFVVEYAKNEECSNLLKKFFRKKRQKV